MSKSFLRLELTFNYGMPTQKGIVFQYIYTMKLDTTTKNIIALISLREGIVLKLENINLQSLGFSKL